MAGARETGAGAGTCSAAAPGVKVNLKPSPSRLSKQKQRPDQADEYSLPQKSNPSAPAPTQKSGSSGDRLGRKRKPQGKSGAGGTREPLSSVSPPSWAWLHPPAVAKVTLTHFMPQRGSDPLHHGPHLDVAPGTTGKGLSAAVVPRWPGGTWDGVHPSSFELRSRNQSLVKLVGRPVPRLSAPPQSSMLLRRALGGGLRFPLYLKGPSSGWGVVPGPTLGQALQTHPPSDMSIT